MNEDKIKYTFTSKFLFPLLGINKTLFNINKLKFKFTRFINCYLGDKGVSNLDNYKVYLVHRNYQSSDFKVFEETLMNYDNYVDGYDINNGEHSVKIFKIPDEFKNDYDNLLVGRYSYFSKKAIDKILSNNFTITTLTQRNTVKAIFNKNDKLKQHLESKLDIKLHNDAELLSILNVNKNLLSPEIKKSFIEKSTLKPNLNEDY